MDYYSCQIEELRKEIQRRGYTPYGTGDQLSESLTKDDDTRGADATTVKTEDPDQVIPRELNSLRMTKFGQSAPAALLVNESACAREPTCRP